MLPKPCLFHVKHMVELFSFLLSHGSGWSRVDTICPLLNVYPKKFWKEVIKLILMYDLWLFSFLIFNEIIFMFYKLKQGDFHVGPQLKNIQVLTAHSAIEKSSITILFEKCPLRPFPIAFRLDNHVWTNEDFGCLICRRITHSASSHQILRFKWHLQDRYSWMEVCRTLIHP